MSKVTDVAVQAAIIARGGLARLTLIATWFVDGTKFYPRSTVTISPCVLAG